MVRRLLIHILLSGLFIFPFSIMEVQNETTHRRKKRYSIEGSILAHAFFPRYGGDVHFDEDENWSFNKTNGVDLYAVAVHEIGHALGLKHSFNDLSIMAPFYKQYTGEIMHLHNDDIMAIGRLYGSPEKIRRKPTNSRNTWKSELCKNSYLDAVTKLKNGTILAFRGKSFFELKPHGEISKFSDISRYFPFDGPIDAATTDKHGNIYIFKKDLYWILNKQGTVMPNYPEKITVGLANTPDGLSAALHYEDGKPYFFKKSKFWPYSRHGMKKSWPRGILTIFNYKGFPKEIDAAFHLDRNVSFIFHKNRYWKVSGSPMTVLPGYPRSVSRDWFKCPY